MVSTGDPLDWILAFDVDLVAYQWAADDFIYSYDELIGDSQDYPLIQKLLDGSVFEHLKVNGKAYFKPQPLWPGNRGYVINKDWLDKLNLEIPTTLDEYYEVLKAFKEQVSFVNGDMDYPIIIGSGTNAAMQPNYNLPANKTQSGIRTRSTPGGNPDNFNELRFEDKKDHEEVFLQAEKDWNIRVKNDKSQYVGHDEALDVRNNRTKTVGVDQTVNIGSNHTETTGANRNETVGRNKTELVKINSMETIGAAKELSIGGLYQISVGGAMNETVAGAKAEEVGLAKAVFVGKTMDENVVGSRTSKVGENFTETVNKKHYSKADEFVIEASKITLKSGSSTIVIDGNSITFKASKISGN